MISKAIIDLGDDSKKDKMVIDSKNQICKSFNINHFNEKDRLIVGSKKHFYSDLKCNTPGNSNVSFRDHSSDTEESSQNQDDFKPVSSNGLEFL